MGTKHLAKGSKILSACKGKIRLYSNKFCPYAQRIHLVLDSKNLQYETVYINLVNKPEWFLQKSPFGQVPVLELENGEIIYDSLIIANYLDEKYPQKTLHRKDPLQRAKDSILIHRFNKIISSMHKVLLTSGRNIEEQEQIIREGLQVFNAELLTRGEYFGESKPGMVDYMIWPWVERSELLKLFGNKFSLKHDKFQRLMDWKVAMMDDNAVKKNYLDTETHIRFLQSYRAGIPEYDLILSQL